MALFQFLHKAVDGRKIVAAISVADQNPFADSRFNPSPQCVAVALFFDPDDPGPMLLRNIDRLVLASVISDNDFPAQTGALDAEFCFFDASGKSFRFIQTRHYDGQIHGMPTG
ncbi:MAG TPA: hypothetical protein VN784_02495 [Candidatus Limnocylindrales bacterium]|nr:hypothetical protein [Candidatus Limnocylindrales bacterium]